jgi:hypothetical protein
MQKHILLSLLLVATSLGTVHAQTSALEQLTLDIAKLSELKTILQDMYSYYSILDKGYEDIKSIAKGNFNLNEAFLDALLVVSPAVQGDPRVTDIVSAQLQIVQLYQTAFAQFKRNPNLSAADIATLSTIYGSLLDKSAEDMEELTMVLTDGTLRMSDDERLSTLDRIHRSMHDQVSRIRYINSRVAQIIAQRGQTSAGLLTLKNLYGL